MNTKLIAGGALTGLVLAGSIAGMVSAQSVADATGLTEEQVIEIALMEIPGEVQEVELENHRGTQIYEIEIISADGEEMEVEIRNRSQQLSLLLHRRVIMLVENHSVGFCF